MERTKLKRLTIDDRATILARLRDGEKSVNLAKEYNVTKSAISKLKLNADKIITHKQLIQSQNGNLKKKRVNGVENTALEKALYDWFLQKRSLGEPVSGPALCEKALLFNQKLNGSTNFKASGGWLHKFKKRHGIGEPKIQGERLSADIGASTEFCATFQSYIQDFSYKKDLIYNADETRLQWKSLPNRTLADGHETVAHGRKIPKDRVTVMVCTNASGNHKLPLLVIGKSARPRCFKGVCKLRVVYKAQKNACIDRALFTEWYREVFLPEIEAKHPAPEDKCILILDNSPSHPPAEELNAIGDKCTVIYLPSNVTAISQPMNQGVIEKLKRMYRKYLLRELLLNEQYKNVFVFFKQWSLLHCCSFLAAAWDTLTQDNIQNAWRKMLGEDENCVDDKMSSLVHLKLLHQLPDYKEISHERTTQWLEEDKTDPGWKVLSDDEIVYKKQAPDESKFENEDNMESEAQEEDEIPSPREALLAIDKFVRWYQRRSECTDLQLFEFQQCRDIAASEILS